MRSTLYEALEIEPTSDVPVIRAALRTVLRRFWSAPRDASGDNEEAVRFVALSASILTDDARREAYDASARPTAGSNPWRADLPATPGSGATNSLGGDAHEDGASALDVSVAEPALLPAIKALAEPLPEEKIWSPAYVYAAAAAAALILFFGIWMLLSDSLTAFSVLAVWLLALCVSYAIAASVKASAAEQGTASLSRLAIVKWRRESSVFVGSPPPQQDTAWIFRLRVMELTRSAAGYSTLPRVAHRVLARLADYGLIAFAALLVLGLINAFAPSLNGVVSVLRSPLVLPIIVVLLGVAYDVFWLSRWRTTPGKWLVGAVVATGVTQADDHTNDTQAQRLWRRARKQALDAMAFGIWPLAMVRAGARLKSIRSAESSWDAASDSVVALRATPVVARAAAVAIAVSAASVAAHLWIVDAKALQAIVSESFDSAKSTVASVVPALPSLPDISSTTPPTPATAGADSDTKTTASASAAAAPANPGASDKPAANSTATPANPGSVPPTSGAVGTSAAAGAATASPNGSSPAAAPVASEVISPKQAPQPPPTRVPAPPSTASKAGNATVAKSTPLDPGQQLQTQLDAQTRAAQERRNRIDKVAAQVSTARQNGNYANLQGVCQRWTEDQPASAEAWRCLGLAKFQAGAGRDALPALRQALKLDPNDPETESAILRILRP
jgi:hypothetical protein